MADTRFYNIADPVELDFLIRKLGYLVKPNHINNTYQNLIIDGVAALENADARKITFFNNPKYTEQFNLTKAGACITFSDQIRALSNPNTVILESVNPYMDYRNTMDFFYSSRVNQSELKLKNGSYISSLAEIGQNLKIGYGVVIEDEVTIGDNCEIDSNVVIKYGVKIGDNAKIGCGSVLSYCTIGRNFICLPGVKIGQDGFGFATNAGVHHKIFHIGKVIIGNDVEIGANSCIDRGALNETIIGDNSKIDNLVQIAHGVKIGSGCFIVAQSGIAGSSSIGNYCALGGQSGISGHLQIADMVQIAAGSGVVKEITQKGLVVAGYPAVPVRNWHRQSIYLKNIVKTNK